MGGGCWAWADATAFSVHLIKMEGGGGDKKDVRINKRMHRCVIPTYCPIKSRDCKDRHWRMILLVWDRLICPSV